ncbi:NUDIX domain-containing protein [Natronosporangium hydrolyticum]|uniref:NUDIX domain-containing protein n=1 Tax=Natronosporangium hydrolyticum TaxID=2811111 RepID=A0A895Y9Z6_9ACTN|nr:NUDIX domain-containing protein [Natronosporangium hydrolyticum]QSB14567.1 NUDIX domain-containing protein [Natronosporangium hydrolyticum]
MGRTWTHPDVLTRGVREGWADPQTDPTRIDWPSRQRHAAIPFKVINGRPLNPTAPTGIRHGRGELGHWGEAQAADAMVTADHDGHRWLLMVERADRHGWALPGGHVDPGEQATAAAIRELREETGLRLPARTPTTAQRPRIVPDPRATDEAWMVTTLVRIGLGAVDRLPAVHGGDDAARAAWCIADTYQKLTRHLATQHRGQVFAAHRQMLADALAK